MTLCEVVTHRGVLGIACTQHCIDNLRDGDDRYTVVSRRQGCAAHEVAQLFVVKASQPWVALKGDCRECPGMPQGGA